MQGKKIYQEKLFANFQLSDRVPKNNFYRRLHKVLDLDFLYKLTRPFYGESGQESIDPIVFFKLCLVGYLENIISDRKLISHCAMRLDILYFIGYDIDEPLPWHSTISRTRQLYTEAVFEEFFTKVLQMCINKGMVSGHTQAIDSAPIKANASMDTLELKVPADELEDYLLKVRHISDADKPKNTRKAKENKASKEQQTVTAKPRELQDKEQDCYICPQGKTIPFKKVFRDYKTGTKKKEYRCSSLVCKTCPIKQQCLGKTAQEKKFTVTYYREEYERNNKRVNSKQGRYMKYKRSSTVEPVFGTLTQFMGLRKINTIGINQANKVMHMAAIAYNIKKYLKFTSKTVQTNKQRLAFYLYQIKEVIVLQISNFKPIKNLEFV